MSGDFRPGEVLRAAVLNQRIAAQAKAADAALTAAVAGLQSGTLRIGTWRFAVDGARNNDNSIASGQFYFQSEASGAVIRCQGYDPGPGEQVGFLTSGYSPNSPPVLVMHRDAGTRAAPLPVGLNDYLGVWSLKGTIANTGAQGVGAYIRAIVTENTAVTGTLGTDLLLQVAGQGNITPTTQTFRISHDNGLTYKGVRFVDSAGALVGVQPGRNWADNPGFDVWQAGTSFAIAANTDTQLADRWKTRRTTTGLTISRQTGFNGAQYCLRSQRDSGATGTGGMQLFHHMPIERVRALAGRTLYVSMHIRCGANYSGGTVGLTWYSGTTGGETLTMTGAGIGFPTGGVATGNGTLGTPTTSAARVVGAAFTVPSSALDLALRILWTPTGTAGADDWIEITNVRIAEDQSSAYTPPDTETALQECLRYYRKSFALAATPAQNAGAGTGETRFPAITAGATTQRAPSVRFGSPMRAAPAVTLYNPAAANAQVHDLTAAADCSASATANVSEAGFDLTATGNASTAAGNHLAFHWIADARL